MAMERKEMKYSAENLFEAIGNADIETAKKCIENDAHIEIDEDGEESDAINESEETALHLVMSEPQLSMEETYELARLLLSRGASINAKDENDNTPLHNAIKAVYQTEEDRLEMVKFLVRHGANITQANGDGHTPLELAKLLGHKNVSTWLHKKIIYRQQKTQNRFFSYRRISRYLSANSEEEANEIKELKNQLYDMHTQKDNEPIEANDISGRRLLTADGQALKELIEEAEEMEKPITKPITLAKAGWFNGGYKKDKKKVSMAWGWEKIEYHLGVDPISHGEDSVQVKSQYNPQIGHMGNFRMRGIGDYGEGAGQILYAIYEVTKKDAWKESEQSKEEKLASLFLTCLKTGSPVTTELLQQHGLYVYTGELKKDQKERLRVLGLLNRVLLLTGIKEITRRMHGSAVNLPLAIGYVQGLKLVRDGHMRMQDLFDKNAKFGLPTANSLQSSHVASAAREKLKALNLEYAKHYGHLDCTRESFHQLLHEGYGGADDSEGEEYETSDHEDFSSDEEGLGM